ncbi:MAG: serine hydrolase domain-containing protein [Verrucomicrobiota bacterium]
MAFDPDFSRDRVSAWFRGNFSERGDLGAAVSVWQNGISVLELQGGFRDANRTHAWSADTLVLVWSATKGIASACLLHALQENAIALDRTVAEFWPEFAQNGKASITLSELISHAAGLCALDQPADVTDYDAVITALARQQPLWSPGSSHGYHARTFGFLLDEILRRIAGVSLSEYWRRIFGEPLGLDFWIGLPAEMNARCATIYAAKVGRPPEPAQFYRDLATPGTLQRRTFTSPHGLHAVSAMNKPQNRALALPSFGGIGSATALGKFYAMLANGGGLEGKRFFSAATIELMATTLSDGTDRVFEIPTAFSAGLMKNPTVPAPPIFGPSPRAFGHPGAGGSHALADPENNLAFAYVMNQMEQSLLPNEKSLGLIAALYSKPV